MNVLIASLLSTCLVFPMGSLRSTRLALESSTSNNSHYSVDQCRELAELNALAGGEELLGQRAGASSPPAWLLSPEEMDALEAASQASPALQQQEGDEPVVANGPDSKAIIIIVVIVVVLIGVAVAVGSAASASTAGA